jgi:hypothetical protein
VPPREFDQVFQLLRIAGLDFFFQAAAEFSLLSAFAAFLPSGFI